MPAPTTTTSTVTSSVNGGCGVVVGAVAIQCDSSVPGGVNSPSSILRSRCGISGTSRRNNSSHLPWNAHGRVNGKGGCVDQIKVTQRQRHRAQ